MGGRSEKERLGVVGGDVGVGIDVVEEVKVEGVCQSSMRDPRGAKDFDLDFCSCSCEDDEEITTGGSNGLSFLTFPSPAAAASLLLANALFPFVPPALVPIPAPVPLIPPNPPNPVPTLPPTERCCTTGNPVLLEFEENGRVGDVDEDVDERGEGEERGLRSSIEPMSGLWVCVCCCAIDTRGFSSLLVNCTAQTGLG